MLYTYGFKEGQRTMQHEGNEHVLGAFPTDPDRQEIIAFPTILCFTHGLGVKINQFGLNRASAQSLLTPLSINFQAHMDRNFANMTLPSGTPNDDELLLLPVSPALNRRQRAQDLSQLSLRSAGSYFGRISVNACHDIEVSIARA